MFQEQAAVVHCRERNVFINISFDADHKLLILVVVTVNTRKRRIVIPERFRGRGCRQSDKPQEIAVDYESKNNETTCPKLQSTGESKAMTGP